MKILVICQYYFPEPFRVHDICKELTASGHEVYVIAGTPNYPSGNVYDKYKNGKNKDEVIDGVKIHRSYTIPRRKSGVFRFLNYISFPITSSIYASRLNGDFDVVYVYSLSPAIMGFAGIKYKKKHKKPLIIYNLDLWPESLTLGGISPNSLIYKVFNKLSGYVYKSADKLLCSSESFIKHFNEKLSIPLNRLDYQPQYDDSVFSYEKDKAEKGDNKFHFVFAGNIGVAQSVETIIEAAKILHSRDDIVFDIIGDGVSLEKCKNLAKDLNNVLFHGRISPNEVAEFSLSADAFLITFVNNVITHNTLPAKTQTYMHIGKPILAAAGGEVASVIEKSGSGFSCDFEDSKGLADIILKFINCDNKEEMAENARRYYEKNFTKKIFFSKLIDTFENTEVNL